MPNSRITTSCLLQGRHVEGGATLKDVSPPNAADLVAAGGAVVLDHREPEVEHRDPEPARAVKSR